MARTDIAGLLTGISSGGIDPVTAGSAEQQRLAFGAQRAQGVRRGLLGAMGKDPRTTSEKLQMAMAQLDLSNPADLRKLAGIQQATGRFAEAAKTAAAIQQLQQEEQKQNTRQALLRIARAQGNDEMVEFIESGGDLNTASSVLFRAEKAPEKPTAQAALSSEEFKNYNAILESILPTIAEENWPESISVEGTFRGRNVKKKNQLRPVFIKAEELRRLNPNMSLENALRQASNLPLIANDSASSVVSTEVATGTDTYEGTPIVGAR